MGPVNDSPPSSPDLYSTSGSDDFQPLPLPRAQNQVTSANGHHPEPRDGSIGATREIPPVPLDLDMISTEGLSHSIMTIPNDSRVSGNAWNGPHKRKREMDPESMSLPSRSVRPTRLGNSKDSFLIDVTGDKDCDPRLNGSRRPQSTYQEVEHARTNCNPIGLGHEGPLPNKAPSTSVPLLPHEIWHHTFCFVPPVFLGRLLRVNRTFNDLLTPAQSPGFSRTPQAIGALKHLSAESIWAASRKRFCPGLPKPIKGCTELDMWRLLRGNHCQVCGEKKTLLTTHESTNPWQCGPGQNGVRVIWPFGIRSCGMCMRNCSEKEVTLLFSSTFPSFLLPALPCAFMSQSDHFVASTAIRNMVPPTEVVLTKHYYKLHIEDTKRQFEHARELGSASAEEWIKGLDDKGKERSIDATRWEQWEAKGGLKKVNTRPSMRTTAVSIKQLPRVNIPSTRTSHSPNGTATQGLASPGKQLNNDSGSVEVLQSSQNIPTIPPVSRSTVTSSYDGLPQRPQGAFQQARPERSIRDVNEAKAARRADIERRCMTLEPPLEPNVLHHMESFQAAIQISTPLTDAAWDVLKPRLLAQRESAARREDERIQQGKILQAKSEERRQQEAQLKEAKETLDKEWDAVQTPIRHKLAKYADEIIQDSWSHGSTITKDTCPKFAADVLVYARRRFYDSLAQEDAVQRATGKDIVPDVPNCPPTRKLILENMKWLFDNKIKAFTENFQKELFLCNGCEGNFKFYGFEGVIQHYAAKHTTSLSLGSIVVHWRSEWPEHPPFNPNPSAAKAAYYAIPMPLSATMHSQNRPTQATSLYNGYGQGAVSGPQVPSHGYPVPQFSSSPYHVQYQNELHQDAYHPVATHQIDQGDLPGHPLTFQPNGHYPPLQSADYPPGNTNSHGGYPAIQATPPQYYSSSTAKHAFPNIIQHQVSAGVVPSLLSGPNFPYAHPSKPPLKPSLHFPAHVDAGNNFTTQGADLYQTQMNDMAKHARDVWFGTSGIKDIPQSVRIFVVIHHVASRFEQKYTNEPSLSMFIDGLNLNALMRPVRSLNGLACRTCVTCGNGVDPGSHIQPQAPTSDRKLYTLPHLLNHFRTVHMERGPLTQTHHSGIKPWRLDWKRDMVELPESPLIADLINAPGMDDAKLQLIAWVFPDVFPSPLPKLGPGGNLGPVPRYRGDYSTSSAPQNYKRDFIEDVPRAESGYLEDRSDGLALSRPYSTLRPLSPSTERTPEPPGEDEYDPHRPTYLGRIIQANTTNPVVHKQTQESPSRNEPSSIDNVESDDRFDVVSATARYARYPSKVGSNSKEYFTGDQNAPLVGRVRSPVEDQLGSHHYDDFNARLYSNQTSGDPIRVRRVDQQYPVSKDGITERYVSEDGEVDEEPALIGSRRHSLSPVAERTAAEKFLNDFNPSPESGRQSRGLISTNHERDSHFRNDGSESSHLDRRLERREGFGKVSSMPRKNGHINIEYAPKIQERIDPWQDKSSEYSQHSQKINGYAQLDIRRPTTSRIEFLDKRDSVDRQQSPIYASYDVAKSSLPHSLTEESTYDPSGSRYHVTQQQHRVHHRGRSRSPEVDSIHTPNYRTRSPLETSRQGSVFQVPSLTQHRASRIQRPVYYNDGPAQDEYGYARSSCYPEGHPHRRIEYIPVRPEEYATAEHQDRFVITQPAENREPADQTRFVRGYVGDHIYKQDSNMYYTQPRIYETRASRSSLPASVDYNAYRRDLV